jgi:hypothetical protein
MLSSLLSLKIRLPGTQNNRVHSLPVSGPKRLLMDDPN